MEHFWESSPEWQRKQVAWLAFQKACIKVDAASVDLLTKIRCYGPQPSTIEDDARTQYFEATEEYDAVLLVWREAKQAFAASPAGKAYVRYLKDPLAPAGLAGEAA